MHDTVPCIEVLIHRPRSSRVLRCVQSRHRRLLALQLFETFVYFGRETREIFRCLKWLPIKALIHVDSVAVCNSFSSLPLAAKLINAFFIKPNVSNFWPLEFESLSAIFQVGR